MSQVETTMPSNLKKLIRARRTKTGERYSTALRHVRQAETRGAEPRDEASDETATDAISPPLQPGDYTGTPRLPAAPMYIYFNEDGDVLPSGFAPRLVPEQVFIQGDYEPDNLHKAWVPDTSFEDPSVPAPMLRVLSLGEYIDARAKQLGWELSAIEPGPIQDFHFLGESFSARMYVTLVWSTRARSAPKING